MGEIFDRLLAIGAPASHAYLQKLDDQKQANLDLAQFAQDPTYRIDPSKYKNVENGLAVDAHMKGLRDFALQEQAAPILDNFTRGYKNAVGAGDFTDPASMEVLKSEGVSVPSSAQMLNPFVRKGVAALGQASQNEADAADIANPVFNGNNPPANVIARFVTQGGEKATNQLKTLADLAKQNDEVSRLRGKQGWINAAGNSPEIVKEAGLRTIIGAAPYGTILEDLSKMGEVSGAIPKLKPVETGTGQGEQRQQVIWNERTGETGGTIGQPWLPSAPKVNNNIIYQGDKKGLETLIGSIPKTQEEATTAQGSITRIDRMLGLIDQGAAGAQGYAKAAAAPILGLFGVETKGMNDAQIYQTLAKTMAGGLRASVVGPGPVSNYEQDLLKSVSAGGTMAPGAAKELLKYYRGEAQRKIGLYNNTIDSITALAPETAKAYKKIGIGGNGATSNDGRPIAPAGTRANVNGKIVTSDGKGGWN